MTDPDRVTWRRELARLLRSAAMARSFTLATFAALFSAFAITDLAGQVTYVTIISGLCVVGAGILAARHRELSFARLVPVSLILVLVWTLASVFWSVSRSDTLTGWIALAGVAFLAIVVGHVRDTLQTVRALGDVLRWLLAISLGAEVLIGILMRTPVHWLGIQGNIIDLGPVEGIFGTRNRLGFVAVLALITFITEWRTASIRPGPAAFSVVLAGLLAVLSGSPTVLVLAVAVGAATGLLAIVRRLTPHRRDLLQWTLGAVVIVGLSVAWTIRHQLIAAAGADFTVRANLWRVLSYYVQLHPVEGFGWMGAWPSGVYPFASVNFSLGKDYTTALNAYADLVLQVGWVGLVLFAAMVGVALARAWLVASQRRSVLYTWTPLMLVAMLVDSLFESFTLMDAGWLVLIVCVVRAGQSRSWRERVVISAPDEPEELPGA